MKNDNNKTSLATEIIAEQKNKIYIYKIISNLMMIINIILLILLFINRR